MRYVCLLLGPVLLACEGSAPAMNPPVSGVFAEPDAVEVGGEHYSVEFENDRIRVLRVRLPPGQRSPQHRHPEYCAVFLTPARWRFTAPDGAVTEAESSPGAATCSEGEIHSPENVGPESAELILIELKDGAD